jgi:hypothetical protein
MNIQSLRPSQKLFLVQNGRVPTAAAMNRCAESIDFVAVRAQVTEPQVDTAGKHAPLSNQEGN